MNAIKARGCSAQNYFLFFFLFLRIICVRFLYFSKHALHSPQPVSDAAPHPAMHLPDRILRILYSREYSALVFAIKTLMQQNVKSSNALE
jgi:hypothetical protein